MKKRLFIALFAILAATQTAHFMNPKRQPEEQEITKKTFAWQRKQKMNQPDESLYYAARDGKVLYVAMLMQQRANPYTRNYERGDTAVARVAMLIAQRERFVPDGPYRQIYFLMTGNRLPVERRRRIEPSLCRRLHFGTSAEASAE